MTGVKVDTFKKHLDHWMMQIPDLPKCNGYQRLIATNSNAIYDQGLLVRRDRGLPKMGKIIGGLCTFLDLEEKPYEITSKFFLHIGEGHFG